jgi:hypothetical protein
MREVVGFAAGVTVTAGLGMLLRTEGGKRLLHQVMDEAHPEARAAATEWEPLIKEVVRAVRLGVREAVDAWDQAEAYLARLADEGDAARAAAAAPVANAAAGDPPTDLPPAGAATDAPPPLPTPEA